MQIALFQILLNIIACIVLVPLFYLEVYSGISLMKNLATVMPGRIEQQMAYVFLLFNVVGAVTMVVLTPLIVHLTERLFPPTQAEDDARLHYIHDQALQDPETSLDLVELEQQRLLGFFTRYFELLRPDAENSRGSPATLHKSFKTLTGEIDEFLDELGQADSKHILYERLNGAMKRQRLTLAIEETLYELIVVLDANRYDTSLRQFSQNVIEALNTAVLTLHGAVVEANHFDRKRLEKMTGDRSAYLTEEASLDANAKLNLLKITNLYERFFWLLGGFNASIAT